MVGYVTATIQYEKGSNDLYRSHYRKRCLKRTRAVMRDDSHSAHDIFQHLPSGRRLRSIGASYKRMSNSFFHRAIAFFNETQKRWCIFWPILYELYEWYIYTIYVIHYRVLQISTLLTHCIILICNYCRAMIYSVILTNIHQWIQYNTTD